MPRLARVLALAAALMLTTAASPSGPAVAAGHHGGAALDATVTVGPGLVDELAGSATAEAVVTAWTPDGLDAVEALGVEGARLRVLPMLLVPALTGAQLALLEASPAVRSVWANERFDVAMEDTTWITGARDAWGSYDEGGLDQTGYTGAGVEVAVIDTGADGRHADFGNLAEFCEARQSVSSDRLTVLCSPFDPATGNAGPAGPTGDPRLDSVDDNGHGTHVAGTIGGTGAASGGRDALHSTIGMAPDVTLRSYSSNVGGSLVAFQILGSYDDLTYKRLHGFNDVVAVNNSWGGGDGLDYDPDDPVNVAVNAAYDAGILSVFAAGNAGPEHDTLSRQCVNPFVVCVGASTKPDAVVMFSSRGRPSLPADTDRDGVPGGEGDVAPDNHDRALAQARATGLYRPALVAPGVNINAMMANSPACYEGLPELAACYEALNGTSMAAPHVAGATAVVSEAFRAEHGRNPTPAELTDVLERSAVTLPGYAAEEQGAGRLDVAAAVELAQAGADTRPLTLGTPVPPYAEGAHPGAPATVDEFAGCTGTLSWSTSVDTGGVVGQPPAGTERFGQHTIDVPEGAERLRVTADWGAHPSANLYLRLWRPGVDPGAEHAGAGPDRVFPDNESVGLLTVGTQRWLDVRAPVPGEWLVRVYHRAGGVPAACDPSSSEDPKLVEGFNYDVTVEIPQAAETPGVAITGASASDGERFVDLEGTAAYPDPWDGVVTWEVPGTELDAEPGDPGEDDRLTLHFRGNVADGCSGVGPVDVASTDCPYLHPSGSTAGTAATWTATSLMTGTADRNIYDPSWTWWLDEPVTVQGPMTVEWWASCAACTPLFDDDWYLRVWADGDLAFEQRVSAGVALPAVPERMEATVTLPAISATERLVLHVDPVYVDSQAAITIHYDGEEPCGGCDSLVRMPLGDGGGGPAAPADLRVVDLPEPGAGLRVAWDPVEGASTYEVHRSGDPLFEPSAGTLAATTAGEACSAPDVPTWPGASREGLCWTDAGAGPGAPTYYRVVAAGSGGVSQPSLLAYGTSQGPDRQVRVLVDRLFGPGHWEHATLLDGGGTHWQHTWDRLGLDAPLALDLAARSFTQGVGSAPATEVVPGAEGGFARGAGQVAGEGGDMDGTAATFSLRARDGEGGRLDFRDGAAGVRVRALSVDGVTLTGPGRAELTGTARVERDGQASEEPFTLAVEDNGTPGRGQDVFEISTDTYSGGGTLVAGAVRVDDL